MADGFSVAELRQLVSRHDDELAAMPNVVGWGVGLAADTTAVVQIFVDGDLGESDALTLRRSFGEQVEFIHQAGPADAL